LTAHVTSQSTAQVPNQARAFWVTAPGRGEIRAEPLPEPGPADVIVRALCSGVSRGTESLVFAGRVPDSERERMRAPFQSGDFPGPVKYGYASVGVVEEGPPELRDRHVFVLHPHQDRFVVPASALHIVPERVPPGRAVLAANLETAINGVWDARVSVGDRVVVIGAGTVGCLVAWLIGRLPGCAVTLVDINPSRAEVARTLGVAFSLATDAPRDADIVLHASGSAHGLTLALDTAGFESTVVELSWYGDGVVPLCLGGAFHSRRLTIKSSQVGHVAGTQRARWTTTRRMRLALELLSDAALDVLISGESAFEDLPRVMSDLAAPGALCHRIWY
jgi:threonine dehydrogenase-like Zn-dependent dehydrogenase